MVRWEKARCSPGRRVSIIASLLFFCSNLYKGGFTGIGHGRTTVVDHTGMAVEAILRGHDQVPGVRRPVCGDGVLPTAACEPLPLRVMRGNVGPSRPLTTRKESAGPFGRAEGMG